ncbi:MAG: hypothetical protein ABJ239_07470 [Erythrobacter sp.]
MMFGWLKKKIAASPSMVVTGAGVLKTHDVEARFRQNGTADNSYHGKLKQSRWSDGQERFSLRLRDLGHDHGGEIVLFCNNNQVSEFELSGADLEFRWKGMSSDAIPQFEIGDQLRVDAGPLSLTAIVEPD